MSASVFFGMMIYISDDDEYADYLNPFHAYDEGNLSWLVIVCFISIYVLCIYCHDFGKTICVQ